MLKMPTAGEAKIRPTSQYHLRNNALPKTKSVALGKKKTVAEKENAKSQSGPVTRSKSKIPVSVPGFKPKSRRKGVPDFAKLHQQWNNKFEKGKAVTKKSCTQVREFDLTRPGTHFKSAYDDGQINERTEADECFKEDQESLEDILTERGISKQVSSHRNTIAATEMKQSVHKTLRSIPVPQTRRDRKPEVNDHHPKKREDSPPGEKSLIQQQRDMGIEFQEDVAALASILNNTGLSHSKDAPAVSRQTFATSRGLSGPRGGFLGRPSPSPKRTSIYYQAKRVSKTAYKDYADLLMRRLTLGGDGTLTAPSRNYAAPPTAMRTSIYYTKMKPSTASNGVVRTPRSASRVPNRCFQSALQKQEISSSPMLSGDFSHNHSASSSSKVQPADDTVAIPSAQELAKSLFSDQAEKQTFLCESTQQMAKIQEMEELEKQLEMEIQMLTEMDKLEEALVIPPGSSQGQNENVPPFEMASNETQPQSVVGPQPIMKDIERLRPSTIVGHPAQSNEALLYRNDTDSSNPLIMSHGHPSTVSHDHPSTIQYGDSSAISHGNPTNVSLGNPSTVSFGNPSTVSFGNPSTVSFGNLSTVSHGHPSTLHSQHHQPSTLSLGLPAAVSHHPASLSHFHPSPMPHSHGKYYHSLINSNQSNVDIPLTSESIQTSVVARTNTQAGMMVSSHSLMPPRMAWVQSYEERSSTVPNQSSSSIMAPSYSAEPISVKPRSVRFQENCPGEKDSSLFPVREVQPGVPCSYATYQNIRGGTITTDSPSVRANFEMQNQELLYRGTPGVGYVTGLGSMSQIISDGPHQIPHTQCLHHMPNSQFPSTNINKNPSMQFVNGSSTYTHQVHQQAIPTLMSGNTHRAPVVDNSTLQIQSYLLQQPLLQRGGILYTPVALAPNFPKVVSFASPQQILRPPSETQRGSFRTTPHPGILKKTGHPQASDLSIGGVQGKLDFDAGEGKQTLFVCPKKTSSPVDEHHSLEAASASSLLGEKCHLRPTPARGYPATDLQSEINDFLSSIKPKSPRGQAMSDVTGSHPAGSLSLRGEVPSHQGFKSSASDVTDKTGLIFKDALLDKECSLYSFSIHGNPGSGRVDHNPIAKMLSDQDGMHFCPILGDDRC